MGKIIGKMMGNLDIRMGKITGKMMGSNDCCRCCCTAQLLFLAWCSLSSGACACCGAPLYFATVSADRGFSRSTALTTCLSVTMRRRKRVPITTQLYGVDVTYESM